MRQEQIAAIFNEVVEQIKEFGFKVYSPQGILDTSYRYGYVTDGKSILYFEVNDFGYLLWSVECVPTPETGTGKRVKIPFTKEGILKGFSEKYGKPYADFEEFKNNYWKPLIEL